MQMGPAAGVVSSSVPASGDLTFRKLGETVRRVVLQQVDDELRNRDYTSSGAQEAATTVAERCMIAIRELTQDFKIISKCRHPIRSEPETAATIDPSPPESGAIS